MRRSLLGYRRRDVDRALAEADAEAGRQADVARAQEAHLEQLEQALLRSHQSCGVRDRRVAELESELDRARAEAASQMRGLALLGAELEELRVSARGRATRIRLDALREAAEVSVRVRALADAKEPADSVLAAIERAVDRIGASWDEEEGAAAEPPAATSSDELEAAGRIAEPEAANGASPGAAARGEGEGFGGNRVSVDIGPFSDFSQLVSFEDAANAIGAANEISIRRFSRGRANIDVDLREPVDLLRELEERCDLSFEVRKRSDDEIILDLDE